MNKERKTAQLLWIFTNSVKQMWIPESRQDKTPGSFYSAELLGGTLFVNWVDVSSDEICTAIPTLLKPKLLAALVLLIYENVL